jgi:hypothetical protein
LEAAGLASEEIYRYRSWDEDGILDEIRRLQTEGADLSSKSMDESSNKLIATARRRFGNWGSALEKAGINYADVRRRKRWTRENLVEGILELKKQGVKLITPEVKRANPSLFAAIIACHSGVLGTKNRQRHDPLDSSSETLSGWRCLLPWRTGPSSQYRCDEPHPCRGENPGIPSGLPFPLGNPDAPRQQGGLQPDCSD